MDIILSLFKKSIFHESYKTINYDFCLVSQQLKLSEIH